MEKDLNKYLTPEQASKKNYLTAEMIQQLCERRFIPFFQDREEILVNPDDIKEYLEREIFGVLGKLAIERKRRNDKHMLQVLEERKQRDEAKIKSSEKGEQ